MRRLFLLIAALALLGFPGFQPPGEEPVSRTILSRNPTMFLDPSTADTERGPIVLLTMDDSAASTAVVNKANAAANGTAARNTADFDAAAGSCKVGTCLDFYNGSTADKVDLGSDVIGANTDYTFCAWLNPGSIGATSGRVFENVAGSEYVRLAATVLNYNGNDMAAATWSAGTFAHWCFTRAVTSRLVYKNGVSIADGGGAAAVANFRYIGNRGADDRSFDGLMDDVRIYDYALTPSQIQKIYNAGSGHQRLATGKHQLALDSDGAVMAAVDHKGIEFYQSTAASRPTLTKLNGKRVLSFDGSDDNLVSSSAISSIFTAKAKSFALVASPTDIDAAKVLFGETGDKFQLSTNTTGSGVWKGLSDATNVEIAGSSAPTVLRGTHDGTLLKLSANGVDGFVSAVNTTAITGTMELGTDGTSYFTGSVGPIAAFNKVLPESDLLRIEQGLAKEYGVSLAAATAEVSCDAYIRSLTPTLWLDSGDLSTITKDGSNKVSAWASKIGAVTFTQATGDSQPTWTGDGVLFSSARGDNLASVTTLGTLVKNNAKTIFVVGDDTDSNAVPIIFFNSYFYIGRELANSRAYAFNADGAADTIYTANNSWPSATNAIIEVTHDGSNLNAALNGVAASAVASGVTANVVEAVKIGLNSSTYKLNGRVREIITDDSVWTADQRARVRSCLGQKYGVSF